MRSILSVCLIGACILMLTFIAGCGDDTATTPTHPLQSQFEHFQQLNLKLAQSTIGTLGILCGRNEGVEEEDYHHIAGFQLLKAAAPDHDSVLLVYDEESAWWHAFFSTHTSHSVRPFTGVKIRDSIQFLDFQGNTQPVPASNTDYMHTLIRCEIEHTDASEDTYRLNWRGDLRISHLSSVECVINGPLQLSGTVDSDSIGVDLEGSLVVTMIFENLRLNSTTGCAESGTVHLALQENVTNQFATGGNSFLTWTADLTAVGAGQFQASVAADLAGFEEFTFTLDCPRN